jgi:hypothetical protein
MAQVVGLPDVSAELLDLVGSAARLANRNGVVRAHLGEHRSETNKQQQSNFLVGVPRRVCQERAARTSGEGGGFWWIIPDHRTLLAVFFGGWLYTRFRGFFHRGAARAWAEVSRK